MAVIKQTLEQTEHRQAKVAQLVPASEAEVAP
jgi:hypothetical protein